MVSTILMSRVNGPKTCICPGPLDPLKREGDLVAHDGALVSAAGHAHDGALVPAAGHALDGALVSASRHGLLDGALVAAAGHGLHD